MFAVALMVLMGTLTVPAQESAAKAFEKLKKEVEGVAKDTGKYGSNLNSTMQSLSKVSSADTKNKVKDIKSFQKKVEDLNKTLKKTTDRISKLREKREQYFTEWEKSITAISSPELQKASEERRQKVMNDHEQLTVKATELRERIDGFMNELNDLSTFLGNDPTAAAADTAKGNIDKVLADGTSLEKEVQDVANQLSAFAKGSE